MHICHLWKGGGAIDILKQFKDVREATIKWSVQSVQWLAVASRGSEFEWGERREISQFLNWI